MCVEKLLDNNRIVVIFRNTTGTYTSACINLSVDAVVEEIIELPDESNDITDDITAIKSLNRLSEKVFQTGKYVGKSNGEYDESDAKKP